MLQDHSCIVIIPCRSWPEGTLELSEHSFRTLQKLVSFPWNNVNRFLLWRKNTECRLSATSFPSLLVDLNDDCISAGQKIARWRPGNCWVVHYLTWPQTLRFEQHAWASIFETTSNLCKKWDSACQIFDRFLRNSCNWVGFRMTLCRQAFGLGKTSVGVRVLSEQKAPCGSNWI